MRQAKVLLDRNFTIGRVDPRLFGAFVEHLGRGVYGGLYEPGHPTADERGFRRDVLDLVKELGVTIVRYPGGNFVSTLQLAGRRRSRRSEAEAAKLCLRVDRTQHVRHQRVHRLVPPRRRRAHAGGQPRHPLTRGCRPLGRVLQPPWPHDVVRASSMHGWDEPHGVKFWCLGNEMDGDWQTAVNSAEEYGRLALQAAKMMRWADDSIQLAASGSSGLNRATYGYWDATVLEHAFDQVDWISLHTYLNNWKDDTPALLASADLIDGFIEGVIAVADAAAAKRRSSKRIMVSFDEWNVWYRTRRPFEYRVRRGWPVAPPILEEVYSVEDALAVGGVLISFLNHADRVRCACLAQLVNVIAPITTQTGGPAWRQTIFYPFAQTSRSARGDVLRAKVACETYAAAYYDPYTVEDALFPVPQAAYLKLSAVAQEDGSLVLFALNRDVDQEMTALVDLQGFGRLTLAEATVLTDSDLEAANSKAAPMRVKPRRLGGVVLGSKTVRMELPPASWSVVNLKASP